MNVKEFKNKRKLNNKMNKLGYRNKRSLKKIIKDKRNLN